MSHEPCLANYLRLMTIQAIADHWHFATHRSVYTPIAKWRAMGLLDENEKTLS